MSVRVLFFGATAAAAGKRETYVEVADSSKVAVVTDLVIKHHPNLEGHKLLFSVNQEYAEQDASISDGDELAIFTAVSGG